MIDTKELARALQGVAAMVFGTVVWVWAGMTLAVLLARFGAYALLDGLAALYRGVAILLRVRSRSIRLSRSGHTDSGRGTCARSTAHQ